MKKTLTIMLILFGFFISCHARHAPCVEVKSGHPRIWLTPGDIANLRIQLSPGGKLSRFYPRIKNYIEPEKPSGAQLYQFERYYLSLLLLALVEPDKYFPEITNLIDSWTSTQKTNEICVTVESLIYDWFFDRLGDSRRRQIANHIALWWQNGDIDYYHSSWNNHTTEEVLGYVLGPLAVYGDGYVDAQAERYLARGEYWLFSELIPATNQAAGENGGWAEGPLYAGRGAFSLWQMAWAWATATNRDALAESRSLANLGKFLFHISRPHDGLLMAFADNDNYGIHGALALNLLAISKLYKDGYARYLWDKANPSVDEYPWTSVSYGYLNTFYVLLYNETKPISPASAPKAMYFDGMGMVTMRTGYGKDDIFFGVKFTDLFAGHGHLDVGHFELSKGGTLAIDSGVYEGGDRSPNGHYDKYYKRTIAHNTITVFDPNEIWDTTAAGEYPKIWPTNDGGQRMIAVKGDGYRETHPYRYGDVEDGSIWDTAAVRAYEHNDNYTYVLGDCTNAYSRAEGQDEWLTNSRKLKSFTRQVLFLRPDYFVIYDRVSATDPTFSKRWLLHSVNQPQLDGTLVDMQPEAGALSFEGDATIITEGKGKLFVKTVFPAEHITTKRGGRGFEYWANYDNTGENPTFNTTYFGHPPAQPGNWRIEVAPKHPNYDDVFLHVLYPTDLKTKRMPQIKELTGANINGVKIANKIAIFSKSEEEIRRAEYQLPITSQGDYEHIVCNLQPSTSYTIFAGNLNAGSFISTENGVLIFILNLPMGEHTIRLLLSSDVPPESQIDPGEEVDKIPQNYALLQNYPNPFNAGTWIPYKLPQIADAIISVYSANGQLVHTLRLGKQEAGFDNLYSRESGLATAYWDGRNDFGEAMSNGLYFYTMRTDAFSATRRMLLVK